MAFLVSRAIHEQQRIPEGLLLPWERGGFLGMVMRVEPMWQSPMLRGTEFPVAIPPALPSVAAAPKP